MSDQLAREHVARGAEFLDEVWPGWAETVWGYGQHLDLASCGHCVLGVLYGDFLLAIGTLDPIGSTQWPGPTWPAWLGFDIYPDGRFIDYLELKRAWLREAEARILKPAPVETRELVGV